ncbi:hypothetical protein C4J93_2174 [Pseudomonas sp. R2-37-08W]|nr:hypothetical protein C4J93_2174 [Pseudomonas sp. R2-37-08W]
MDLAPRLRHIMFDPLAYLHPSRLSRTINLSSARQRSALNGIFLDALPNAMPATPEVDSVYAHWVRYWHRLPHIALALGAQQLRQHLAQGGTWLCLPEQAQAFASCKLREAREEEKTSLVSVAQVQACGLSALLAWREWVPEALVARLPLLFPEKIVELQGTQPIPSADLLIFKLALQNDQNYSHSR